MARLARYRLLVRLVLFAQLIVISASTATVELHAHIHRVSSTRLISGSPMTEALEDPAPPRPTLTPARVAPVVKQRVVIKARVPKKTSVRRSDPWGRFGYDISWPQCRDAGSVLPTPRGRSAIVGLTGGRPFTVNPCLAQQWRWAMTRQHHSAYINLAFPQSGLDAASYGAATVRAALSAASAAGVSLSGVWLDIETGNHWSRSRALNNSLIQGAIDALYEAHIQPGIYTTPSNWAHITGNARIHVPLWLAVYYPSLMKQGCRRGGIGNRLPDMVQAVINDGGTEFDWNMTCTRRSDLLRALG